MIDDIIHNSLCLSSLIENIRIPVNRVDNPNRKSFTESVKIRFRYVFCRNSFDEYAITITIRFSITTVIPTNENVTAIYFRNMSSPLEESFTGIIVMFILDSLQIDLSVVINSSGTNSQLSRRFKTPVTVSVSNWSFPFIGFGFIVAFLPVHISAVGVILSVSSIKEWSFLIDCIAISVVKFNSALVLFFSGIAFKRISPLSISIFARMTSMKSKIDLLIVQCSVVIILGPISKEIQF